MLPSALSMETSWEETRWAAINSSTPWCYRKKALFLVFLFRFVLFEELSCRHSCACRDQTFHRTYLAL